MGYASCACAQSRNMLVNDFLNIEGARGDTVAISGEVRSGVKMVRNVVSAEEVWGHCGRQAVV